MSSKSCPSYIAVEGAFIIGNIENGKTTFSAPSRLKSLCLVNKKADKIQLENQLRFAGRCIQNTCKQWNSQKSNCSLGDFIIDSGIPDSKYEDYQNCPITATCRWIAEQGESICKKCTNVMRYM